MAHSGPPPKDRKVGRTPNAEWVEVPDRPFRERKRRELPKLLLGAPVRPEVRAWWNVVRVMPHCVLWDESDWLFVFDTAVLKQSFFDEPHAALAAEIRRREDQLGTTAEARRKLRIRYVDPSTIGERSTPSASSPANVSSLEERRARLANAT